MPFNGIDDIIFPQANKHKDAVRLKKLGDTITFRLAKKGYFFEGLHFIEDKPVHCKRIEAQEDCEYCQKYFEAKNAGNETDMRKYNVKIAVYFVVLDRLDSTLKVLQTTSGKLSEIRKYIREWEDAGKTIHDFDLKLTRTEEPGANYYTLRQIDSSLSPKMSEIELDELKRASETDLETLMDGADDKIDVESLPDFDSEL